MNKLIASAAAVALTFGLAACGSSEPAGPTQGGLEKVVAQMEQAVESKDAVAVAKLSKKHDSCPVTVGEAIVGFALAEGFGVKFNEDLVTITEVTVVGNKGTVTAEAFGETETNTFTFTNGVWVADAPAGGCE